MRYRKNLLAAERRKANGRILTATERREIVARLSLKAKQNPSVGLLLLALDLPAPTNPIPQVKS